MSAIAFTFDEATHCYQTDAGLVVPSTTQVLKMHNLINFDHVAPQVLERKRKLGTLVHRVTELWDRGESLDEFDIPLAVLNYATGYFNFCHDTGFEPDPQWIEHRILGEFYGMVWGMTPDRIGRYKGVETIIELKCGANEHAAWGLQLASYDMGVNRAGRKTFDRMVVQLGPQFTRGYKTFPYDKAVDYQIWQSALAMAVWKMNEGYDVEFIPEREAA